MTPLHRLLCFLFGCRFNKVPYNIKAWTDEIGSHQSWDIKTYCVRCGKIKE